LRAKIIQNKLRK